MKKISISIVTLIFSLSAFSNEVVPKEKDISEVTALAKLFVNKPTRLCPSQFPAEVRVNIEDKIDTRASIYYLLSGDIHIRCIDSVKWQKSEECLFMYCDTKSDLCEKTGRWSIEACDNSF